MSKIDPLSPINASYTGITKLNAHLEKIEAAFENTVSRDGSTPNAMLADLDMNSKQLLNLRTPTVGGNAATKAYVDSLAFDGTLVTREDVLNLKDYGAVGDGVTDDTTAIQAWLAALTANTVGYAPGGNYLFSTALSRTLPGLAIVGDGPFQTIFTYTGANTTNDIITFGDGSTPMSLCYLNNFKVMSTTTMTGGNGLRLRRFQRSTVHGITIDGQDGNGKLYHGIYFDEIDNVDFIDFDIRAAQDGLRTSGSAAGGQAGLMLFAGKILQCNVGFRVGGGMGGIYGDQVDLIVNNTNMVIDTTLRAEANREIILGSAFALDSSITGANIQISDLLAAGSSLLHLSGTWIASAAQDGILIDASVFFLVICQGGTFYNNTRDALRNNSTNCAVVFAPSRVTNSGGYGINSTVANANIYVDGAQGYWAANSLGNANSNVIISQLIGQNGIVSFGASPRPAANDGAALGISGTAWSDLFLASGGVVNWNAGDVTLTHSSNALSFAGASSGYSYDATLFVTVGSGATAHQVSAAGTAYTQLYNTTAGADLKYLRFGNAGGSYVFEKVNDAYNSATSLMSLDTNGVLNVIGNYQVDAVQVVGNRATGWGAPTGTATRTTFVTSTVTLEQLAQRVKALIDDLTTHGLIGT
jgi:hypothetical protein